MGELMTQLSSQTSRLVRDEMRLAQKEFVESAKHAGIGAGLFSAAGLLAVFGLGSLIAAMGSEGGVGGVSSAIRCRGS